MHFDTQVSVLAVPPQFMHACQLNLAPSTTTHKVTHTQSKVTVFEITYGTLFFLDHQASPLSSLAIVVQFDRVCSMLGKGRHERGQVLEQLVSSAMLVQGCWVVQSALVIPREKARLRLARDYVVRSLD